MTPGARLAAAAEILDRILDGQRAEPALTGWARASRFAGSKDRAAVRDLVFDALRCRRSYAVLGGSETGRGLVIGGLRAAGADPATLVTGKGYGMAALGPEDAAGSLADAPEPVQLDMPDWLAALLREDRGDDAPSVMAALRQRAPVFLRVNLAQCDREAAQVALAKDSIPTEPVTHIKTALLVIENERRIRNSEAYLAGLVELQDAASQAAVLRLPLRDGMRALDYCAGGGGKSLAMAALADVKVTAHDALPRRMADLGPRAARAGAEIQVVSSDALTGAFDLVLVDAPCSGSGTWRRDPDTKWRLTEKELVERTELQADILTKAAEFVRPGGTLAYATCSVFACENSAQAQRFLVSQAGWTEVSQEQWLPGPDGDGFFLAQFQRAG